MGDDVDIPKDDPWRSKVHESWTKFDEQRMNIVGQNGNDGEHYAPAPGQIFPVMQLHGLKIEGVKYDTDKIKMELIPPELLTEVGKVLTFGAKKYSERNWEKGMDWGRVYGALQRHLNSWMSGEEADPETGYSHLSHARFTYITQMRVLDLF